MKRYIKSNANNGRQIYEFFYRIKGFRPEVEEYDVDAASVFSIRMDVYPDEEPIMVFRDWVKKYEAKADYKPSRVYDIEVYTDVPESDHSGYSRPTKVAEYDHIS